MGKNFTPTLEQTSRLLALVPYISTHQNISVADLSEKFGISKKDLIEDLNTLWMCGLPGYTPLELIDLTFDEGFVSIRNAEILQDPRSLTTEEVITLILGLDLLSKSSEMLSTQITSLQEKLRAISGDIARAIPSISSSHRAILSKAINERSAVTLKYFSPVSDEITNRLVWPLTLESKSTGEYLLAMTDSGIRTFKLDRVSEVELQLERANLPKTNTTENDSELSVDIKILDNLRSNIEKFQLESQALAISVNDVRQVTGFSSEWFIRAAMSSSGSVQILSPEQVRIEIGARSAALLEAYESGALPN
jgi:proteasome accessory factor C